MHVAAIQAPRTRAANTQASTSNKEPSYLAIAAALASFALLILSLRIYTRIRLLRFFAIDDWLVLGAAVGMIGALVSLANIDFSGGQSDFDIGENRESSPWLWIFDLFTIVSVTGTKTSVACLVLRMVKRTVHRRMLYIVMAPVASTGLAWFATVFLQCVPVTAAWETGERAKSRCLQRDTFKTVTVFYNSLDATTNLLFAIIPMSACFSLHHAIRNKVHLIPRILMTSLGLLTTIATVIRLMKLHLVNDTILPSTHAATTCICSVIEITAGMTAACLPPLKPLLTTVSDFFTNFSPKRNSSSATPADHHDADSPPPSPYPQSYSTPTFLSLPRPKPTRYHDHTSDLDFDLFEAPSTTRSRAHSRTPSNLTVFTTFTNFTSTFTVPPFDRELEGTRPRAHSKAMSELERPVDLGGCGGAARSGYAVSVTSGCGSGETCDGSEEEKTIRKMASVESCGSVVVGGGIMRTTEVTVT